MFLCLEWDYSQSSTILLIHRGSQGRWSQSQPTLGARWGTSFHHRPHKHQILFRIGLGNQAKRCQNAISYCLKEMQTDSCVMMFKWLNQVWDAFQLIQKVVLGSKHNNTDTDLCGDHIVRVRDIWNKLGYCHISKYPLIPSSVHMYLVEVRESWKIKQHITLWTP